MFKKVCILTTVHYVFDIRIFHKEAKSLLKGGYDVTLIAQHDKNERIDGIKVVPLPKGESRIYRMFRLTMKTFSLALKQKADIYHFHDPELLLVGLLLKIFTGKKVIYDVHEDYRKQILSKPYLPVFARKSIAIMVNFLEFITLRYFDVIITATDNIFLKFSYHNRVVSIKNLPVLSGFSNTVKNNKSFTLVYIGCITEIRGLTNIIKALELIDSDPDIKLILCGKFYPHDYEEKVRRLEGFRKVEYLGWIESDMVPELLSKCDAGIICFLPEPNHIDSMPNKLFEYIAAGLPVIASNFPAWRSIIDDNNNNRCGLCIDPLDPTTIASAIKYLMDNPREAEIMGINGRELVLAKFNWANEEQKLLKIYKDLS